MFTQKIEASENKCTYVCMHVCASLRFLNFLIFLFDYTHNPVQIHSHKRTYRQPYTYICIYTCDGSPLICTFISFGEKLISFHILLLFLYFFPFHLLIFAIRTRIACFLIFLASHGDLLNMRHLCLTLICLFSLVAGALLLLLAFKRKSPLKGVNMCAAAYTRTTYVCVCFYFTPNNECGAIKNFHGKKKGY